MAISNAIKCQRLDVATGTRDTQRLSQKPLKQGCVALGLSTQQSPGGFAHVAYHAPEAARTYDHISRELRNAFILDTVGDVSDRLSEREHSAPVLNDAELLLDCDGDKDVMLRNGRGRRTGSCPPLRQEPLHSLERRPGLLLLGKRFACIGCGGVIECV
jgi:hypothetical protein